MSRAEIAALFIVCVYVGATIYVIRMTGIVEDVRTRARKRREARNE
jgi:hypothetical protein